MGSCLFHTINIAAYFLGVSNLSSDIVISFAGFPWCLVVEVYIKAFVTLDFPKLNFFKLVFDKLNFGGDYIIILGKGCLASNSPPREDSS